MKTKKTKTDSQEPRPRSTGLGDSGTPDLAERYEECLSGFGSEGLTTLHELLVRASRTFAVGIEILPYPLRDEITVAYLLLRVSDYLEDNQEIAGDEKVFLLEEWRRVLDGGPGRAALIDRLGEAAEDTPDASVARHTARVLEGLGRLAPEAREIVVRRVRESSAGMARWTERGSEFGTEEDLDDYMHEVAGRVGHLLTELFAHRLPGVGRDRARMMALGREFGLALQTVNVIRGLHEDRHRGWVYVPASFLPDGMDPRELFEPANHAAAMTVLERLVEKADRHLAAARSYMRMIPRRYHRVRLFCLLPLLFAVRTLAISRTNPEVLDRETKMSRREVLAITRRAKLFGFSNRWIARYCRRLAARGA